MPVEVLRTVAGPALLDDVHARLDALWESAPEVPATDRTAFATAVAELAANVVEHAAQGAAVPVLVELTARDGVLSARLEDGGVPLPETQERSPGPLDESGRGLLMARALTDELAYARVGDRNRWDVRRTCRG